jgi:hypothetical protein
MPEGTRALTGQQPCPRFRVPGSYVDMNVDRASVSRYIPLLSKGSAGLTWRPYHTTYVVKYVKSCHCRRYIRKWCYSMQAQVDLYRKRMMGTVKKKHKTRVQCMETLLTPPLNLVGRFVPARADMTPVLSTAHHTRVVPAHPMVTCWTSISVGEPRAEVKPTPKLRNRCPAVPLPVPELWAYLRGDIQPLKPPTRGKLSQARRALHSICHCPPPFSYALTSALNVMTLGCTPAARISATASSARSHCPPPLSYALTGALNVMTLGCNPAAARTSATASSARYCPPPLSCSQLPLIWPPR